MNTNKIAERVETALTALETALEDIAPELEEITTARRTGPRDPATLHALRRQEAQAYRKGPFAAKNALLAVMAEIGRCCSPDTQRELQDRFGARAEKALDVLVGR